MIKYMKITTPSYEERKNLEIVRAIGFGIYIECGINDADKIFNLVKEMTDRRYSIEPEEREDDD